VNRSDSVTRTASAARPGVLALGVVYLVLAIAGFVRTGTAEFGLEEPLRLFGVLGVSTLANIVHAVVGVAATVAALRRAPTVFAAPATVAFFAMAVFGAVSRIVADTGDPLNLTWWNVGLYLLSSAACAAFYWTGAVRTAREGDRQESHSRE
jgi:hypothetical protein